MGTGFSRGALARIRSAYDSLTPTEQKVADYCLKKPEEVIYYSVTQLGDKCGVGESTIIRFAQSVGFSGYQDLKLNLAIDLQPSGRPAEDITIHADDSLRSLVDKVTRINIDVLRDTAALIREEDLERAVQLIIDAQRVFFFGVGSSGLTALDAGSKFLRIGIPSLVWPDAHLQMISAAHLGPGDVAVAFSHSGSTRDTVESVAMAKKREASTICITDSARSPITEWADVVLLTSSAEDPLESGALRSKIAQVHVLDLLYTGVAVKLGEKAVESRRRSALAVVDRLY